MPGTRFAGRGAQKGPVLGSLPSQWPDLGGNLLTLGQIRHVTMTTIRSSPAPWKGLTGALGYRGLAVSMAVYILYV